MTIREADHDALLCKALKHKWDPTIPFGRPSRLCTVTQRCDRCASEKDDWWDAAGKTCSRDTVYRLSHEYEEVKSYTIAEAKLELVRRDAKSKSRRLRLVS